MSSEPSLLKEQLQRRLDGAFPSAQCPYERVAVLVLYWLEDDFTHPCSQEAEKVINLFKNNFGYETQIFPIPSRNSQNALEQTIATFKFRNEPVEILESALLIVYYSGHGDPDLNSGKAVWAAKITGEPTIDWFLIQPMLMRTEADVLLIFDCCYASLAGKGRNAGSRVDLLAAAPDAGTTPSPGPYSFTQHFVDVIKQGLNDGTDLQVSNIASLIHKQSSQTPIYLPLRAGRGNSNSIVLRPLASQLHTNVSDSISEQASGGAFSFTIIVNEPPSELHVKQFGEWIKTSAPKLISSIRVDSIIDLSNSLREFALDEGKAGVKGRYVDTLPEDEKQRIVTYLCDMGKVVALAKTDVSISISSKAHDALCSIEQQTLKLSQSLWHTLTHHPDYQSSEQLENLRENPVAQHAEISQAAQMSLLAKHILLASGPEAVEIPSNMLRLKRTIRVDVDRFVDGTFDKGKVLVEIFPDLSTMMGRTELTTETFKIRLKKIYSLLAATKPSYFRTMQCLGFSYDSLWYGLVFRIPANYHSPRQLRQLFQKMPRMPLEKRYAIACSLATSLGGLHSVHWVHKGIRSDNILFFIDANSKIPETTTGPWLFGFDGAREDAGDSNKQADYRVERRVYLPPSRWGTPTEKFSYTHDIYALGVVLLEIGLWLNVLKLHKSGFKDMKTAEEAQDFLVKRAGQDLGHAMGSEFSGAVIACLTGKVGIQQDRNLDFQRDVLDVLEELCKHKPDLCGFTLPSNSQQEIMKSNTTSKSVERMRKEDQKCASKNANEEVLVKEPLLAAPERAYELADNFGGWGTSATKAKKNKGEGLTEEVTKVEEIPATMPEPEPAAESIEDAGWSTSRSLWQDI